MIFSKQKNRSQDYTWNPLKIISSFKETLLIAIRQNLKRERKRENKPNITEGCFLLSGFYIRRNPTSFFFTLFSVTAGIARVKKCPIPSRCPSGSWFQDVQPVYVTHVQTETRDISSPLLFNTLPLTGD